MASTTSTASSSTASSTETTWTDADAQAWAALVTKKAASEKAALAPIIAELGSSVAVQNRIAILQAARPNVSTENQIRIDRIIINLQIDVLGLIADGTITNSAPALVGAST